MSLLVDVREVPWRLFWTVRARILANRQRKEDREGAARVRGMTRPRPQQKRIGATMSTYRRPEPVPLVLGDDGTTGLVWWARPRRQGANFSATWMWSNLNTGGMVYAIDQNDRYPFSIGSGDGQVWIDDALQFNGIHAFRESFLAYNNNQKETLDDSLFPRVLCLPIGNGSAIALVIGRAGGSWVGSTAGASTPTTVQASDAKAYLVSHTTCRALTLPTTLRNRLNDLLLTASMTNPVTVGPQFGQLTTFGPTGPDAYWYSIGADRRRKAEDVITPGGPSIYVNHGANSRMMELSNPEQFRSIAALAFSPALYVPLVKGAELLADLQYPFAEGYGYDYPAERATLRQYGAPAPSHVATFDTREADYEAFTAAYDYSNPQTWLYRDSQRLLQGLSVVRSGSVPVNNLLPQSAGWGRVKRLLFGPNRTERFGSDTLYGLYWHYDWGQPAYCRQQLLALGFTEADLTP